MDQIISLAIAEGLWAVLFCALLVYQLRDSRKRENKYNEIIDALSAKLGTVELVKSDTAEIKTDIEKIKSDTEKIKADTQKMVKLEKSRQGGTVCVNT